MKYCILLTALFLSGCYKPAESTQPAGSSFQVDTLFTVDGCTVYRFEDSRAVYFTSCKGQTSYDYTVSNGKSSSTYTQRAITESK